RVDGGRRWRRGRRRAFRARRTRSAGGGGEGAHNSHARHHTPIEGGSMKAIRAHKPGGPEGPGFEGLGTPRPGPGQLLVHVEAAGVNFIDIYHRTGLYPLPAPIPLGREGAGVVEAGDGLPAGTRVAWCDVSGSYATHVLVPAARAVPIPGGIDSRTAAAAMLQGLTAHYLVTSAD